MATTVKTATKKTPKKTTVETKKPKKISKAGQWMREHPKGDMIINDKRVLYGATIYEIFN
jgi:hypothetical protein